MRSCWFRFDPVYCWSVGLVQREIEAAGISTISLSMMPEKSTYPIRETAIRSRSLIRTVGYWLVWAARVHKQQGHMILYT